MVKLASSSKPRRRERSSRRKEPVVRNYHDVGDNQNDYLAHDGGGGIHRYASTLLSRRPPHQPIVAFGGILVLGIQGIGFYMQGPSQMIYGNGYFCCCKIAKVRYLTWQVTRLAGSDFD
jgi:hypothetical protein